MVNSNSLDTQLNNAIYNRCFNEYTSNELVKLVNNVCNNLSLDYEKVSSEIITTIQTTPSISNISAFVRSILARLNNAEYRKRVYTVTYLDFHVALSRKGFVGKWWEQFLIDDIEQKAINDYKVSIEDLRNTNHAIVEYCINKNYKTLAHFKDFLLRSKILRNYNFLIEEMEMKAKKMAEHYEEMLTDIETVKGEIDLYGEDKYYRAFGGESAS